MKYRIKIEEVIELENKYPNYREIYSQEKEDLDLEAVIVAVNKLAK